MKSINWSSRILTRNEVELLRSIETRELIQEFIEEKFDELTKVVQAMIAIPMCLNDKEKIESNLEYQLRQRGAE